MPKSKVKIERLPIYEMVVDDNDVTGIKYLSIVENPAIEVNGYAFKKRKWQKRKGEIKRNQIGDVGFLPPCHFDSDGVPNCKCYINGDGEWITAPDACAFCKNNQQYYIDNNLFFNAFALNKEEQIIAGPAMIPSKNIYRNDEEGEYFVRFSVETIKKLVQKFTRDNNNRSINVEHTNTMVGAYIMEHWIVKDSVYDASNTYGFSNLPVGTWFVVMKIEDKNFWNDQVKGQGKKSFSIEGLLGRKLVKMSESIDIDSFINSMSDDEILDILGDGFSEDI